MKLKKRYISLCCLAALNLPANANTEDSLDSSVEAEIEEIQVIGKSVSYANNETTENLSLIHI